MQNGVDKKCIMEVSDKERHLIELLRSYHWGRITIFMEDSQPVRTEREIEGRKL